jgi:hypothetical protein
VAVGMGLERGRCINEVAGKVLGCTDGELLDRWGCWTGGPKLVLRTSTYSCSLELSA